MYWLPYSSHTSHHPSQTPCLPWISSWVLRRHDKNCWSKSIETNHFVKVRIAHDLETVCEINDWLIDWLIDFNGISVRPGLHYAKKLGNHIHWSFTFTFLCSCSVIYIYIHIYMYIYKYIYIYMCVCVCAYCTQLYNIKYSKLKQII